MAEFVPFCLIGGPLGVFLVFWFFLIMLDETTKGGEVSTDNVIGSQANFFPDISQHS